MHPSAPFDKLRVPNQALVTWSSCHPELVEGHAEVFEGTLSLSNVTLSLSKGQGDIVGEGVMRVFARGEDYIMS